MANPNIVNVTSIHGMTDFAFPTDTSPAVLLTNPASSGEIWKVNSLMASNVLGSTATTTITVNSAAAGGGTAYSLASTISVPADATLIVTDKTTSFYLKEDQSVVVTSGTASAIQYVVSYEVIS